MTDQRYVGHSCADHNCDFDLNYSDHNDFDLNYVDPKKVDKANADHRYDADP